MDGLLWRGLRWFYQMRKWRVREAWDELDNQSGMRAMRDRIRRQWWIAITVLAVVALIVFIVMRWGWGFGASTTRTIAISTAGVTDTYETQPGKTLWDWMELLLVPIALA
jgi:hypothetical protein